MITQLISLSKIRELSEITSEWRAIIELIKEDELSIEKVYNSLNEKYLTEGDLLTSNYLSDNDYYYSEENYVLDFHGNIIERDESFYCEYYEHFFPSDESNSVNDGSDTLYYSDRAINNSSNFYSYNGEYYTSSGLQYNDLVIDCDGDVCSVEDVYYWESDDEYHHESEDEDEDEEEFLRGYHDGSFKSLDFEECKSKYTIGFEIEKEDKEVKTSIYINDFESELPKWRKEHDGSLNDDSGFELISPIFQFDIKKIFQHIEESETLKEHINAKTSFNCGGHINLGHKQRNGAEVFELISGYTPLLYSLYFGRVDKNYSKGKSNKDLKEDNEKYQAIKIHSNRIEFRIFSAVPNINTLKWRCELINLMLKYPTNDAKKAFYYVETRFNSLLSKQYKTKERMQKLKQRIKENSMKFEKVDLSK
jgi:hypothetical protein